jgi:malonyl-CoA/methylmalonyl-CoA synthetase
VAPETIPLIARAHAHKDRTALVASDGHATYAQLLEQSAKAATALLAAHASRVSASAASADLAGERVAMLVAPSLRYAIAQWGIFRAGGVAVPLCVSHPAPELAHVLDDCEPALIVADPEFRALLEPLARERGVPLLESAQLTAASGGPLPEVAPERAAMLIYTSGTTGKPKGAISTHAILAAQMASIAQAWELVPDDRILHALPLHHLHGILNAMASVLYAGGTCELLPRFEAARVWSRLRASDGITLFMGVPTMYDRLAADWQAADAAERSARSEACGALRLMVSGSAALPVSMLTRWQALSGHVLLERYGMTELGMALGNPLHGERRAGTVGVPFPGVEARIVDEAGGELAEGPGELQIRGPNVFAGYFRKPEASAAAFTQDGFFRTGDIALREQGYYRLLGRASIDIIKTGGYKVSALEIEEGLREHPAIAEVAVVGLPDEAWGERVAAVVVLRAGATLELEALRAWSKTRLAPYKIPSILRVMEQLPRNALGKVLKPELKRDA